MRNEESVYVSECPTLTDDNITVIPNTYIRFARLKNKKLHNKMIKKCRYLMQWYSKAYMQDVVGIKIK